MALGIKYAVWVPGQGTLSPPYLATDYFSVVRGGVTYRLPATAIYGGQSVIYISPLTGATLTAITGQDAFVVTPAGTLATLTVVMPPGAVDTQVFEVATTQTLSSLTVNGAAGQSMGGTAGGPFMLTANGKRAWRFRASDNTWYPA